ncbi:mtDNA inheritance, partitioning of the mitochondrial organelle [Entophlyctis luteolus]|nr:mtDNA inheritance, partitioning of the mitochondrial organelle [Entophlyctis luteolus]
MPLYVRLCLDACANTPKDIAPADHVDHSVLLRQSSSSSAYAPRSLGSLKRINHLYEEDQATATDTAAWNGKVDVRKQDPYEKNEYLTYLDESSDIEDDAALQPKEETESSPKNFSRILNDSVSVWSDFNSMFFHPRSVFELGNYSHNDPIAPFAIFNQGSDIWENDHDLDDVLENRIRYFLEECDNPQGIQVLADTSNAFSGFTAACLESLRGDIGKMNITVFGISDDCDGLDPSISRLNDALALYKLSEVATIYVPLTKPVSRSPFAHSDWGQDINGQRHLRLQ